MIINRVIIPICLFFFFAVSFSGEGENGGIYDQETELCWTDDGGNLCFSQVFVEKLFSSNWPEVRSMALRHYKNKITVIVYGDEGFLTVTFPDKKKMKFPLNLIGFLRKSGYQEGSFEDRIFQHNDKTYKVFWRKKEKIFIVADGSKYSNPNERKPIYYKDEAGDCWVKIWVPTEETYVSCPLDSCPDDVAYNQKKY